MKVCFWGDIARSLKDNTGGGGQLQIALLAKALAKAGNEVTVIDYEVEEDFITADGIKVFKIKDWNKGIPVLRSFTKRLPNLYKSLKSQKADIYYCRIRDFRHIIAYWAARKVKGKFILGLASNLDAMDFKKRLKYQHLVSPGSLWAFSSGFLIEVVYPYLLKKADLVLVQNEEQKNVLIKKRIKSQLFPNIIVECQNPSIELMKHKDFIYVGRLEKRKGFPEFFKIVAETPSQTFKIVGHPIDKSSEYYFEKLKEFKNVKLLGWLNHSETLREIATSKALISTSPMEGFPNVFIESWSYGIPVFSLFFDPGVIEKEKLGKVFNGNLQELVSSINQPIDSSEYFKNCKNYVLQNHLLNGSKIKEIHALFTSVNNVD
ncbi:MAG: glycosyltransferase family 4 protein [Ginsengibacter sp.]